MLQRARGTLPPGNRGVLGNGFLRNALVICRFVVIGKNIYIAIRMGQTLFLLGFFK